MSDLTDALLKLQRPEARPLDEPCTACGAKSLVVMQASAWGRWGGTVVCQACHAKTSVVTHLGRQMIQVEPLDPVTLVVPSEVLGPCPFLHDNIDTLFGVALVPIEDLPTVCTCGAPLTYADEVAFVNSVEDPHV
jgi:hypothetical protein